MSFYEKYPKSRMRITTPSTTGSFLSVDTHRTLSIYKEEVSELMENEFLIENPMEHCLFSKTLELYFRVNEKTMQVNEMCTELMEKQISIQHLKNCTEEKEKKLMVDEVSESIELLKAELEFSQQELEIKNYEMIVKNTENTVQNDKQILEEMKNSIIFLQKHGQEKGKMLGLLTKAESRKDKMMRQVCILKEKKTFLLKEFIEGKHKVEHTKLSEELAVKKKNAKKLNQTINELQNRTNLSDQNNLITKTELSNKDSANSQLKREIKYLEELLNEKNHQIRSRKQWLEDYSRKINSKFALNRVYIKRTQDKQKNRKNKQKILEDCFFELDKMEAKQEAEESKQCRIETQFKGELTSIIQKTTKKGKTVSFK